MTGEQARSILLADGYDLERVNNFLYWDRKHPSIWKEFERVALKAFQDGIKKWGAKGVAEVVRWNLREQKLGDFKFKNEYVHFYARVFVAKHPQCKRFFEFREVGERRQAA